jgi:hypothetical protein
MILLRRRPKAPPLWAAFRTKRPQRRTLRRHANGAVAGDQRDDAAADAIAGFDGWAGVAAFQGRARAPSRNPFCCKRHAVTAGAPLGQQRLHVAREIDTILRSGTAGQYHGGDQTASGHSSIRPSEADSRLIQDS